MKLKAKEELIQAKRTGNGILKGMICPWKMVAFYDGMTETVDEERLTAVIYPDLFKAFDMVPHDIHISKLERNGLKDGLFGALRIGWMGAAREL